MDAPPPVGPMPGHDNIGIVVECSRCRGQLFQVAWMAAPVAADPPPGVLVLGFQPIRPKGEKGGQRLSPRYYLHCVKCGAGVLADPQGPDPLLVRGDVQNN